MDIGEALAGLTGASGVVTLIIKFGRQAFDQAQKFKAVVWSGAAIVLGEVMALVYEFNALEAFGVDTRGKVVLGQIVTGLMIAFESGVLHNVLSRVHPSPQSDKNPVGY